MTTALLITAILTGSLSVLAVLLMLYGLLLASMYPEKVRTNEVYRISTGDLWELRLCRYRRGRAGGEPVLLVPGINANQHVFCAPEGGCLVDYLVEHGYDCWTIDLRGCRSSKPPFERTRNHASLDGFLLEDLPAAIRYICKTTAFPKVHWIGHSLGGMLLYAYAQEFGAKHIASGVTLGSPPGFSELRFRTLPATTRLMIRHFPGLCGTLLRHFAPFGLATRVATRYLPMNMRNLHPSLNPGHFYCMIEDPLAPVLDELHFCAKNKVWRMKGDTLDVAQGLREMQLPLLAVFGAKDPLIDIAEARKFMESLTTKDKQMLELARESGCSADYGHCDLLFGKESESEVFAPIKRWMDAHPVEGQVNAGESNKDQHGYVAPLNHTERAGILSGKQYSRRRVSGQASPPEVSQVVKSAKSKKAPPRKKATTKKAAVKTPSKKKVTAAKTGVPRKHKPTPKTASNKAKAKQVTKDRAPAKKLRTEAKLEVPEGTRAALRAAAEQLERLSGDAPAKPRKKRT